MSHPYAIPLADIEAARERIAGSVIRTPLIRLNVDDAPADIYLKLENLQPIGSFKLRGAGNAIAMASPEQLKDGVYTASAGNMAQGVAWNARRLGLPCTVIVPDHAPETKLAAIRRLGGEIIKVTFDEWWQIILTHEFPGQKGYFIHPVSEPAVMAGNGTIGLEIAHFGLAALNVDEGGLDEMDNKILSTIIHKFKGGPVGITTIATAVGEEAGTIEEVHEPFLIMEGYIQRTPRGREATERAYKHLGVVPPGRAGTLFEDV